MPAATTLAGVMAAAAGAMGTVVSLTGRAAHAVGALIEHATTNAPHEEARWTPLDCFDLGTRAPPRHA